MVLGLLIARVVYRDHGVKARPKSFPIATVLSPSHFRSSVEEHSLLFEE